MLTLEGNNSTGSTGERFDPATRFECWTVADALRASADHEALCEGYAAGKSGAPCPGASRCDAYRLGWEMGAIFARRVPTPAWMLAVVAQDEYGFAGTA